MKDLVGEMTVGVVLERASAGLVSLVVKLGAKVEDAGMGDDVDGVVVWAV